MINVTKAYLPNKEKLFGYFEKIYESAWLTNNGRFCQELEAKLRQHLGVKNLVLVANGTLALQIAFKALCISGSAITTPFSFVATASSLLWEDVHPIFADVDPETWNLDPKNIEKAIRSGTSAIVPVHVFGNPCEVEEIDRIAKKNNLKVIYDAAHAFGAKFKDESVLNWGDVSTLSFHATKLFHTVEGGAIITNDDDLAKKIRLLINFGITGPETIECVGINCKMNEFQAAMGLCVLDELDKIIEERRRVFSFYLDNLSRGELILQKWQPDGQQNYHYFPVLFDSQVTLKKVQKNLNQNEIFPRRYFYPSLDSLKFIGKNLEEQPISKNISERVLCLPIYPDLKDYELQRIIEIINKSV